MYWIEKYQTRVLICKIMSITLYAVSIFLMIIGIMYENPWMAIPWFLGIVFGSIFLFTKVTYRKCKEYYICFYVGPIKNYLIIEDEIQFEGGPFQHNYYGQLPDGTEVAAHLGSFGNVKFAIGSFNNQNISFF